MAKRTVVTLVDDLDGTPIDLTSGDRIRFGIDGRNYEIDLSDGNAEALRAALKPFVEAGRKVVTLGNRSRRWARTGSADRSTIHLRRATRTRPLSFLARTHCRPVPSFAES